MPNTYYEQIIENLNNLRKVAIFHPRLAYLGIASEIEIMFKETNPHGVEKWRKETQDLAQRHSRYDPSEIAETKAVRKEIRNYINLEFLPEHLKAFIAELFGRRGKGGRDGKCRHNREKVTFQEVEEVITKVIDLVNTLRRIIYKKLLQCSDCGEPADYHLGKVFNASPQGEPIQEPCSKCGALLFTYEVPNPFERGSLYEKAQTAARKQATAFLAEAMKIILLFQSVYDEISKEEYRIKERLLQIIVDTANQEQEKKS